MKVVNKGGRPLKWGTPKKLQEQIDLYYITCRDEERPLTIAGLAVWLDCDRQTVYNYAERDEFFDTIKKAKELILASLEERLMIDGRAGQIFLAKNYGYTDKQEVAMSGSINNPMDDLTVEELRAIIHSGGV